MIDVHSYIKGLKSSWIKRLLNNQDSKWKSLIQETLNIDKILNTGSNYIEVIKKEMTNNFWKDTLTAFQNIQEKMTIESWQDFISQPLWHNKKFKIDKKAIFYSSWYNKSVRYVSDLLDEHKSLLTIKILKENLI